MAYATHNTTSVQSGLSARIATLMVDLRARRARRKVFRDTVRELSMLSERDLTDLGLARSEIRRIAYQAAYEM